MKLTSEPTPPWTRVHRRDLPGGGYVAIEVTLLGEEAQGEPCRRTLIRVYVERRATDERRAGHTAPLVGEFAGDHEGPETAELYRMASDNAALARALIDWQRRRERGDRAETSST